MDNQRVLFNKILIIGIIILFIGMSISPSANIIEKKSKNPRSNGDILYVGGTGDGNYTSIQDAINDSFDGDTVFVFDEGSPYYENLNVSKSINLIGENRYTTQINGSDIDGKSVVSITAENVSISGFNIENSGDHPNYPDSGIFTDSDNAIITDNLITYNKNGICFWDSSRNTVTKNIIVNNRKDGGIGINILGIPPEFDHYNTVSHNLISKSGTLIYIAHTNYNEIYKNELIYSPDLGIWAQNCNNINITQNNISNNPGGGVEIYDCNNMNVSWNIINNNGWNVNNGRGIGLQVDSKNNIIRGNAVKNNKKRGFMIYREDTNYNLIIENDIENNYEDGLSIYTYYSDEMYNSIYHNNYINNPTNANDQGYNFWNDSYPSGGNYWDDYNGSDDDGDGIGDTPYPISDGDNEDYYPLMNPWNIPPYTPNTPSPYDGKTDVSINTDLSWKGGDKYPGDKVAYDIYFGTSSPPEKIVSNHSSTRYNAGQLSISCTYYWKIVAWDKYGVSAEGPIWEFTTNSISNNPPNTPCNPNPGDGEVNVSVETSLNWTGGDPDDDTVTYDVYFGKGIFYHKVASNHTDTYYNLGYLEYNKTYNWKIIAWDEHDDSTEGPIWNFKTEMPPNYPYNPDPKNASVNVDVNADLSWNCSNPEGDLITYSVYFEEDDPSPDVLVSINQTQKSYDPGHMNYTTQYYWQVVTWNTSGEPFPGPIWCFSTEENVPPYPPHDPEPCNGAIDVDVNTSLSWVGGDPDNDAVTYDVYFGDSIPPPMVVNNQSNTTFNPGTLEYNTRYYWRIVSWDYLGLMMAGNYWEFTTGSVPNNPPFEPSDPIPKNGAMGVDVNVDLSWVGGDPDSGDVVVYDVFFEADDPNPDVKVADDISDSWFDPGTLQMGTVYYWWIKAVDNHYAVRTGPVWSFTTESENIAPDAPIIDGPASGKPNIEYDFTFNSTDPEDDDILEYVIDWGDSSGEETITGPFSSGEEATGNHSWTSQDTFTIKAKAKDIYGAESNWTYFYIKIEIPRNQPSIYNFNLLDWLLERFPVLERLLMLIRAV